MPVSVNITRRTDLAETLVMIESGWECCDEDGSPRVITQDYYDRLKAEFSALVAAGAPTGGRVVGSVDSPVALHKRREGGSAHSNQYGPCTIRYASAKQTAFVKSLLERKDLSSFDNSVFNLAEIVLMVQQGRINLRTCSDLIDRLLGLPDLPQAARPVGRPASEKQLAFITRLVGEKEISDEDAAKVRAAVDGNTLSPKGASATIEKLLALPARAAVSTVIEAGVYTNGVDTFRVYLGQQSGNMLAAKVVQISGQAGFEFEYAGAASRFISSSFRKLTLEEAVAFGRATRICIVCARRLDVPESVDRGMGPVCYAKMGG